VQDSPGILARRVTGHLARLHLLDQHFDNEAGTLDALHVS